MSFHNEGMIVLEANHVTVSYGGAVALRDVSLRVEPGTVVAVLGRNGAGKTTLLRALAGLAPLSSGTVRWHGRPLPRPGVRFGRGGLRYMPESRNVFGDLTVLENLRSALPWARPSDQDGRIAAVLNALPILDGLLSRPAALLSGGQRQALAIARLLVCTPAVILADEPSLGLAPPTADSLLRSLLDCARREHTTVVIAEQNNLAREHADHVAVLDSGSLCAG